MKISRRNDATRKLCMAALVCGLLVAAGQAQDGAWRRDLESWRAQHAAELLKPDGWLSLAGLEWLRPGDNSFGAAPDNAIHLPAANAAYLGVLRLENNKVTLLPPPGGFPKGFMVDG